MQPSEPEEEVKELVARERDETHLDDPEFERAEIWRREEAPPLDDRLDADWLQGNGWWLILGAIGVALAAWILYIALA
jgi:hypothetical protein